MAHYNSVFTFLDLAILGCNLSENSKQEVRNVFQDIGRKLNLPAIPPIENFPPDIVKQYLTENHLKICVLAVDAETVRDAYGNLSQRSVEYQTLLETAANEVGKSAFRSRIEKKSTRSGLGVFLLV